MKRNALILTLACALVVSTCSGCETRAFTAAAANIALGFLKGYVPTVSGDVESGVSAKYVAFHGVGEITFWGPLMPGGPPAETLWKWASPDDGYHAWEIVVQSDASKPFVELVPVDWDVAASWLRLGPIPTGRATRSSGVPTPGSGRFAVKVE